MQINNVKKFENKKGELDNKKVLFIATKNSDYLRIVQEINLIRSSTEELDVIVSVHKGYFLRIFDVILKILFLNISKYDLVFVGFQPQFIIPLFYWKLKKVTVWTDFFISLYDTLVFDRKRIKEQSFLARIVKWFDQFTLDKSDLIICDTIAHGNYFCEEFRICPEKVNVLYLEADKNIYYSKNVTKPNEYADKYIVFYFGSILPLQGVEVVLEAAELLQGMDNVHFIVVGPIGNKIECKEMSNITYIQWLPQEDLAQYIAFSDLCLAGHFDKTIAKAKRTIPGKAYIYESMKKRIVLGDTVANHELFVADERHIFVEQGNASALACIIENCAN